MNHTSNDKELLKQQNRIRFIQAAQELIENEDLEKVSIRRIAEKAGFHNSTIYLYFEDVDQLILLSSLKYFNEYSKALSELSTKDLTPLETFIKIWNFFVQTVFRKPKIFYNFFFGKHSENLTRIMKQYYELFPEEQEEYSPEIEDMYYGQNIHERCLRVLELLIGTDTRVNEETIGLINDINVSYFKYLLEQKCQNPSLDSDILKDKLLKMLHFIIS
ncbi:TetR/AcrR family transcriptional regulator [Lachnospiraceae bacterium 48-42]|nr:TetR/AcrR family transcriptional regulator [Dorea sp.]